MKQHILVIDDEKTMCDFLAYFLRRYGFRVTTTIRGADALRLLNAHHVHLVILDIVLGDCSGLDLLLEIKLAHPALPVIMLTGLGYQEDALEIAKKNGAAGYLSKTLAAKQLLSEVRRFCAQPPEPVSPSRPRVRRPAKSKAVGKPIGNGHKSVSKKNPPSSR